VYPRPQICYHRSMSENGDPAPPRDKAESTPASRRGGSSALWCILWIALMLPIVGRFGWPANAATWAAVLGSGVLLVLAVLMRGRRGRRVWWVGFGLYYLILLLPFETYGMLDFRSGRTGVDAVLVWEIGPRLRYQRDGQNTAVLEDLSGRGTPAWRSAGLSSTFFGLGSWMDGSDVTVQSALIGQPCLREVLNRLPDDRAKTQVLGCLTDPTNVARVHQEQLLLTLWLLGYPKGHDAVSWWQQHRDIFRSYPDEAVAARLVYGLHDRFRSVLGEPSHSDSAHHHLWVLHHHVRGSVIGGDPALAIAVMQRWVDDGGEAPEDAWADRIAWWPAAVGEPGAKRD
ncbi:hypothetical protein LCGC14_2899450, partial [marine sediment metagenome]